MCSQWFLWCYKNVCWVRSKKHTSLLRFFIRRLSVFISCINIFQRWKIQNNIPIHISFGNFLVHNIKSGKCSFQHDHMTLDVDSSSSNSQGYLNSLSFQTSIRKPKTFLLFGSSFFYCNFHPLPIDRVKEKYIIKRLKLNVWLLH